MGLSSVLGRLLLDILDPTGISFMIDAYEAYEIVCELVETGEISASDASDLKDTINDAKKMGKKIESSLIRRKVHKCGICRKQGHNRRTCPQK